MIRRILMTAVVALGLSAAANAAQPQTGTAPQQGMQQGKMDKKQTVPHVDMSLASIQSGQSYASGLFDMAQEQGAYDVDHASMFKEHIGQDISMAKTHLGHLATAAQGKADAQSAVTEAEQHLTNAQTALEGIDPKGMQPQNVASRSKQVYQELDKAHERLEKAAQGLGVDAKLQTP